MKLYHATTVSGLSVLKANSIDREGNAVLFLTDNFAYSLFYIRDREIDFVTCGIRDGNVICYDEKFPNQLETLYQGRSGWVYEVDTPAEPTRIRGVYVVGGDAVVTGKTEIPDVFQSIHEAVHNGAIQINTFETASDETLALYHEGMVRAILAEERIPSKRVDFFRSHFPHAWNEAMKRIDKSSDECYDSKK